MSRSVFTKIRRYVRGRDLWDLFKILLSCPCGKLLRLFRPHIWLVSERAAEARDNGFWLFRYIRENHPELPVYYPICWDSADYPRIEALGQAIRYGSFRHHVYFWAAEKNISAHVGNGFPAPFMCRLFLMHGFYSFQNIFLQHGIVKDILPFLMADVNRIDLFICSTRAEAEAVARDMGYAPERIACVGLCRYDGLMDFKVHAGQILLMPTWRWYLEPAYGSRGKEAEEKIRHSLYVQTYNVLLADRRLHRLLEENDLTLLFCPHAQMQPYLGAFESVCDRIRILSQKEYDVQTLLRESALLITDYSSVFFDFAYMRKPLLYFQFDYAEFREKHYPEGYFHYDRDGFGPIVKTVDELVEALSETCRNGCTMPARYRERADAFFDYHDTDCCRRNFEVIRDFALPHERRPKARDND